MGKQMATKYLRESDVTEKIKAWESAGFKFVGNGFENNDDDPTLCPHCGRDNIFWALWEHPTLTRYVKGNPQGGEYNPYLLNAANHCFDCDHRWVDEDERA